MQISTRQFVSQLSVSKNLNEDTGQVKAYNTQCE